jgi:hypothetical protein
VSINGEFVKMLVSEFNPQHHQKKKKKRKRKRKNTVVILQGMVNKAESVLVLLIVTKTYFSQSGDNYMI